MQLMPFRQEQIECTINGLNTTNVPLVALDQTGYHSAGLGDNQGIYYFVSHIAKYLNLTGNTATDIFLFFLLALGTSIAICSFFFLFKSWIFRIVAFIGCFLSAKIAYICSDVYITYFFAVSSVIPLFILIKNRHLQSNLVWIGTLAFSGIVIGYSNFIREHAGTTVFTFIFLWIALDKLLNNKQKVIYICLLCTSILIPYAHQKNLTMNRNIFLEQHSKIRSFQETKNNIFVTPSIPSLCKWHIAFIGLGYKENKYGIKYADSFGLLKAKSINPEVLYLSKEYDQILKHEYFSLLKSDPWFVFKVYFRKFLSIGWLICRHVLLGIIFYFFVKLSWREALPFCLAILFGFIPGVFAVPNEKYALGALSLSFLFGLYIIGLGIEKYRESSRIIAKPQQT